MKANRFERGQTLVIIVLAVVAIFGFAALAVDMGRIFAERRRAQSAADSAALSAAYAAANAAIDAKKSFLEDLEKQTALAAVQENGYSLDEVTVTNPTEYEECDCEYIQVSITSKVDPIFSQFVFKGIEKITTTAVARGRRNTNISEKNAIHALSTADDAIEFDGTTSVKVTGGNIYSNGGGLKNGGSGVVSVKQGNLQIAKNNGFNCNGCKSGTVSTPQYQDSHKADLQPRSILDVPEPYCPASTETSETYKGVNYYVHHGITGSQKLETGIHCVYGDIKLNGGDKLTGDGVLIVMKSGGITINGNATVNLKRLSDVTDKHSHSYNGMLIYMPRKNTSTVELGGTADSWISGTIFAPKSTCEIYGNATGQAYRTSIVCDKVKFNGTPNVNIFYKQEENFQMQPLVELIK